MRETNMTFIRPYATLLQVIFMSQPPKKDLFNTSSLRTSFEPVHCYTFDKLPQVLKLYNLNNWTDKLDACTTYYPKHHFNS